ncbi:farnesyl cysteine-carboxyl methyltransferase [Coemansia guatemalensis]|uniref:Protein-S-isoprenylcysteine O-methyltransferase n=1 Tax=Coemansia guatemalensis TaxID=2761395 RepID=A0A9W8HW11_9FUNG|nr:farnesyl cysteine-carboxyl methyltransferase [Coemansia guatemalensis]
MEQDARKRAFTPEVGLFRRRPESSEKWWTPIASVDWRENSPHNIALTACGLGVIIGSGVCAAVGYGWTYAGVFGLYVAVVALYHMLEYLSVALYNPSRTELGSFMFNPDGGNRYSVAMAVSVAEYLIECWAFGRTKEPSAITVAGLVVAIVGQVIRTLAMVTAKVSFNHYVATQRAVDHQLITHGIYRYERHPSYVGFFLWAVGLQTMLKNVVTAILFIVVLGYFFTKRTRKEEAFLLYFFGNRYRLYKSQTPSLIPVANIDIEYRRQQLGSIRHTTEDGS